MEIERPDLSQVDQTVVVYIEALEAELEQLQAARSRAVTETTLEISEPSTTLNVITVSQKGLAKRTPRHLYSRQRRGGMGIFDLETPDNDPPALLTIADENQNLIIITDQARVFKLPANTLPESPVRGRGQPLAANLPLDAGEQVVLVLPHRAGSGYLSVVTETGQVRRLRHHFFGENMTPGNYLYDPKALGKPAAACWTNGDGDLFIATRQGKAIRFAEDKIPFKGCLGLRLSADDSIVAITGLKESDGVFLLTAEGKGTIRQMAGFSANKAPGAGGKVAIKSDEVVGAVTVEETDDIFVISRLSKIIRFQAQEVPPKEGVVQGVNCMSLRADECVALVEAR